MIGQGVTALSSTRYPILQNASKQPSKPPQASQGPLGTAQAGVPGFDAGLLAKARNAAPRAVRFKPSTSFGSMGLDGSARRCFFAAVSAVSAASRGRFSAGASSREGGGGGSMTVSWREELLGSKYAACARLFSGGVTWPSERFGKRRTTTKRRVTLKYGRNSG